MKIALAFVIVAAVMVAYAIVEKRINQRGCPECGFRVSKDGLDEACPRCGALIPQEKGN
jgi:rubrerythrin